MLNPFIINCLKLIQETDIYKAKSAKFKKQHLEYHKAMNLANSCNKTLEEATKTVNKVLNKDGNLENFEKNEE